MRPPSRHLPPARRVSGAGRARSQAGGCGSPGTTFLHALNLRLVLPSPHVVDNVVHRGRGARAGAPWRTARSRTLLSHIRYIVGVVEGRARVPSSLDAIHIPSNEARLPVQSVDVPVTIKNRGGRVVRRAKVGRTVEMKLCAIRILLNDLKDVDLVSARIVRVDPIDRDWPHPEAPPDAGTVGPS